MLLSTLPPRSLGVPEDRAPLRFGSADPERPSTRYLYMAGEPAFKLSMWCGTCPFLFERQYGANGTLSSEAPSMEALERGLSDIPEGIVSAFADLLPIGDYLPLLIEVAPELVAPADPRDYFAHEQMATWGANGFWGLPENPRSFYYRTFETAVGADEHLYEFVVPMVPPSWNERGRVQHYADLLSRGETPAAVALSTLDICQAASDRMATDYHVHWGLTHFLLDGHHKMEAAADAGEKVRLLALVSLEGSLARREDVLRLPQLLSLPPQTRGPRGAFL